MGLGTLNTILNTAPLIIQGATQLVKLLKQKDNTQADVQYNAPEDIDDVKTELEKLHKRLDQQNEAIVEQVQLIEQLAKQNEAIATSLQQTTKQLNFISFVAVIALVIGIISLAWLIIY